MTDADKTTPTTRGATDAANTVSKSATNVVWHSHNVTRQHRETLLRQKAAVLWFTGLSGSGKSTVANALAQRLHEHGRLCYVLDGDNVRHGLNADLGFSQKDREENIRRVGEVAKLLCDAGVIVATAFISPYTRDREAVRTLCGEDFIEIHVHCPLAECERRDVKGLYAKARRGEIADFTGVSHPYEEPAAADITIDTSTMNVEQCVDAVLAHLLSKGIP
jgi:adenylylsulfate kinase